MNLSGSFTGARDVIVECFLEFVKCPAQHLTPPCPHRPPILQTRSCDMDQGVDARRLAAGRAAEAALREESNRRLKARREAARLAGGGTSASGGGGGGVSTNDTLLNTLQVLGGAAGAPMVVLRP